MDSLRSLESYTSDLITASKTLTNHCQDAGVGSMPHLTIPTDAPAEAHRSRREVLAILARLQTLLAEPADFIQHIASQVCGFSHLDLVLGRD